MVIHFQRIKTLVQRLRMNLLKGSQPTNILKVKVKVESDDRYLRFSACARIKSQKLCFTKRPVHFSEILMFRIM